MIRYKNSIINEDHIFKIVREKDEGSSLSIYTMGGLNATYYGEEADELWKYFISEFFSRDVRYTLAYMKAHPLLYPPKD